MNAKILNPAQAKAVYDAMCALNNVCVRTCDMRFGNAIIMSDFTGAVFVSGPGFVDDERYVDQDAFARAYGL